MAIHRFEARPDTVSNMMDETQKLLRVGLTANAVLSFATGLLLAAAPSTVSGWLGLEIGSWLRLFGLALLGHGAIVVFILRQARPRQLATLNVAAIAPYPLLMICLVAFGLVETGVGRSLVLIDGALVGLIAFTQVAGLRRLPTVLA